MQPYPRSRSRPDVAWEDLRLSLRRLLKTPVFSGVAIVTLALCIGANTTIFSLVQGLLIRPVPYSEPERLVEIFNTFRKGGLEKGPSNIAQYVEYRETAQSFESIGLWSLAEATVGGEGPADRIFAAKVTADLFRTLRLRPAIGKFFGAESNEPGSDKVAILADGFWRDHFGGRSDIVGSSILIDGESLVIVGVAPATVSALDSRIQLIRPLVLVPAMREPARRFGLRETMYARLKPGVSLAQAQAEADVIEKRAYERAAAAERSLVDRTGHATRVADLRAEKARPFRNTVYLLQAGVLFLFVVGCANIANLLLARARSRQSELAVRVSLGASGVGIARQLLLESGMLSLVATLGGVLMAFSTAAFANRYLAAVLPGTAPFEIDQRALAFAAVAGVIVAVATSVLPVAFVFRSDLRVIINSRAVSPSAATRRWSSLLVIVQSGIALILLVGAVLLVRSLEKALAIPSGLQLEHVITARIAVPEAYRGQSGPRFQQRVVQGLQDLPGVSEVGLSFDKPFDGKLPVNAILVADESQTPSAAQPAAYRVVASAGYAAAVGLTVVEGRFFEPADFLPGRRGFVVDEAFARKYFPNRSAVGQRVEFAQGRVTGEWPSILGVVRNVPHNGVEDRSGIPFIYQMMKSGAPALTIYVRTLRTLSELVPVIRRKLGEMDPAIALFDARELQSFFDSSHNHRRGIMMLLSSFAGVALFLSALGLYAMLAFDVSQRTHEIGVRGAVGASPLQLIRMILLQGVGRAAAGVAIGMGSAMALSHFAGSLLFQVSPTDPISYVVASTILLAVAGMASFVPACRAARIDPIVVLRRE